MALYRETQHVALWVFALLAGIFVLTVFWPLLSGIGAEPEKEIQGLLLSAFASAVVMLLVVNLLWLRTDVQPERVYVRLGLAFPMLWRRLPLDAIASVEVVRYRPFRDAGGWGYRLGRYAGKRCWYYTMRGDRGVLVIGRDGKFHIIGSQQPEALADAIEAARSEHQRST